jgi:hypothetical protein
MLRDLTKIRAKQVSAVTNLQRKGGFLGDELKNLLKERAKSIFTAKLLAQDTS